jgi:hypothetical protein
MFPSDLDNAYAYEMERHKDEMRDVEKNKLVREALANRRRVSLPIGVLSILALVLAILLNH